MATWLPDSEFGFYVDGTRFLRQLELRVHGQRPIVLNAGVSEDALQAGIDLTNPDVALAPEVVLPGRSLRIARRLTVHGGQLYQLLLVETFSRDPLDLSIGLQFAADFVDVFEVRGHPRERRGELLPAVVDGATVRLAYRGLDKVIRATTLAFSPAPARLDESGAEYRQPGWALVRSPDTVSSSVDRDDWRAKDLRATLGFPQLPPRAPELQLLHRWLDTWTGFGLVVVGVEGRGLRFSLSHIAEGEWRATFMAPAGFGVATTPWVAAQRAAWAAITRT